MIDQTNGRRFSGEYAQSYHAAGFSVVPIRTDGTKAPTMPWEAYQHTRIPPDAIDPLFRGDGVGIIGGAISGGLTIIDNDAPELWDDFCASVEAEAPGLIGRLPQVLTPKKGHHIYLRCEGPTPGNEKLAQASAQDDDGRSTRRVLFETRGEGGYVVAPGSPAACHNKQRTYDHVGGPAIEETPTITVAERDLLFRIARQFNEVAIEQPRTALVPQQRSHDGTLSVGDDYNQRSTWDEILEPHGWTTCGGRGAITNWKRPGKTDPGLSATTGCVSQSGNELLCVFSSNAHPFEVPAGATCGTFTKFAAYAVLNHDGDFSAATKALSAAGYGPPKPTGKNGSAVAVVPQNAPRSNAGRDLLPWKPFPTETLPDSMRNLCEQGAEAIGCDSSMIFTTALCVAATAIGNSRRGAANETWTEPAVVWGMVIAPSGSLKTPAMKLAMEPLEAEQDRLDEEHTGDDDAPRKVAFVTDTTIERLAGILADNPRGVGQFRDESSAWFANLTKYRNAGSDAPAWLELFCDGRLHVHRKTGTPRYLAVRGANVSVCGGIQPGVAIQCLGSTNTENGLLGRILISAAPKKLVTRFPEAVPESARRKWRVAVGRLFKTEMTTDELGKPAPVVLPLDNDASALWKTFYLEHKKRIFNSSEAYSAALTKLERYALRIALIFHLLIQADDPLGDDSAPITADAMRRAIAVVEWYVYETDRIYRRWSQQSEDQRHDSRIVEWMESRGGEVTTREMVSSRLFSSVSEAELALVPLIESGVVRRTTITHDGPGRPGTIFSLSYDAAENGNAELTD